MTLKKAKRKHDYWRVVIVYTDKETSGNRVFKDCAAGKIEGREEMASVQFREAIALWGLPYKWRD
jgi:hypothetical protein